MIYLDEDHLGSALSIAFPNLRCCMGVVWELSDGALLGAHVPGSSSETALLDKARELIAEQRSSVARMYVIGSAKAHNGLSPKAKARAFGVRDAYHFDIEKMRDKRKPLVVFGLVSLSLKRKAVDVYAIHDDAFARADFENASGSQGILRYSVRGFNAPATHKKLRANVQWPLTDEHIVKPVKL